MTHCFRIRKRKNRTKLQTVCVRGTLVLCVVRMARIKINLFNCLKMSFTIKSTLVQNQDFIFSVKITKVLLDFWSTFDNRL